MGYEAEDKTFVSQSRLAKRVPSTRVARYSICTMVTRWDEYAKTLKSFRDNGFDETDCEYLTIDNSIRNIADAYIATNEFLRCAMAPRIILVHQDVLLIRDGRRELDSALDELSRVDPNWGLCGNAGHAENGWPSICLSHPYREEHIVGGPFPCRVVSLDENFIVVKRDANLAVSRDLTGFHHYGSDLCLIADILGWNAYVINFYLRHNSGGTVDQTYDKSHAAIAAKYARAFRPRWIHLVTRRSFFVAGRPNEAAVARLLRFLGKVTGQVPRHHHLDDERRRPRRGPGRGNGRH